MSDKPIAVGDLVQVVRPTPCCGNAYAVGRRVFKVADLATTQGFCSFCFMPTGLVPAAYNADNGQHYHLHRLKRIPPLSELESTKTDEPMKEPA